MKAREVLHEVDRLGVTLWWQDLGNESSTPTIRFRSDVPGYLADEIRRRNDELLKITRWELSREAAGIRHRKPSSPGQNRENSEDGEE